MSDSILGNQRWEPGDNLGDPHCDLPAGSKAFVAILDEIKALHLKKAADYGTDADVFANIRASEGIGIKAWMGCWLRARDKVKRIDTYCLKGSLANEGVEDSFVDLAAYSIIALHLFRTRKAVE